MFQEIKSRTQVREEIIMVLSDKIEPLFFDERLNKSNQGLILQILVSGMETVYGDLNNAQSQMLQNFIGVTYKREDYFNSTESMALTVKNSGEIFGLFFNPEYDRNQREAILLTLFQHSGDRGIISRFSEQRVSRYLLDIMRSA